MGGGVSPGSLSSCPRGGGSGSHKAPPCLSSSPGKLQGAGRESQRRRRAQAALQRGAGAAVFGTPSPTAVAAAAAGTQVRTVLWGGGGVHQQCCPSPSRVQPPFPSPSWDSPQGSCWTLSSRNPAPSPCLCCFLSGAWPWLLLYFLLPLLLLPLPSKHHQPLGVWFPQTSPQQGDRALSQPPCQLPAGPSDPPP